jgi:membrane associated rhomboid family serine protease
MRYWSVTKWLVAINIAVFVADALTQRRLSDWGEFSADRAVYHFQLWRWITYQFLHFDPFHVGFNMIALWVFGPMVEARLGRNRYIAFYLLCGLGGAVGYLLLWRMRLLNVTRETSMIGASACIYGLLVAAASIAPNALLRWLWPPITLRLKTAAWLYVGVAVLLIAMHADNAGGEAAHLGGAAVGFVLIRNVPWLNALPILGQRRRQRFWRPGDPASNFIRKDLP